MQQSYQIGQQVFGNWTIVRAIGQGSFGQVFALQRQDFNVNYQAALKVMSIPRSDAEIKTAREEGLTAEQTKDYFYSLVEDIVREFALMSKLKGMSNVVSYEDHAVVPHADGIGWDVLIRMELLTPVASYAKLHPFSRRNIMQLGIDMCKALELCQKNNIVHRDIKPDNIFVSANGDFKLGDFGIARTLERTSNDVSKKGTYNYMAPEVYRGEHYGFSVDLYSLGIVLYRLINKNRVPFLPPAPSAICYSDREQALIRRMSGEPLPAPFYNEGRLPEIILKACAFDPKDRYSSPQQMRQELEAILYQPQDSAAIYPAGDELEMGKGTNSMSPAPAQHNPEASVTQLLSSKQGAEATTVLQSGGAAAATPVYRPAPAPQYTPAPVQNAPQAAVAAQPVASQGKQLKPTTLLMLFLVGAVIVGAGVFYDQVIVKGREAAELQAQQDAIYAQEQQDIADYNTCMSDASALLESAPQEAIDLYLQAQTLQPEEADAYVNYAYALYLVGDYATCIGYIENDIAMGKAYDVAAQSTLAEILGACYFEQQDYAAAASFFRLCTAGGDLSANAMRDYAVSLARLGDIDAADEALATMFEAGAAQIETTYVQAEVDYAQGEYLAAEASFRNIMETGEDATLQVRALRALVELYRDCASLEALGSSPIANAAQAEAELLVQGMANHGLTYDTTLWEMLAFAYFEAYNHNPSLGSEWLVNAANAFGKVIELGVQKEYLYTNLYTIYYQLGDYAAAEQALASCEAVYPSSYTPHALRATMMIARENQKADQNSRDYHAAYQEFLVAESMLQSNDDKTYYQQVKSLVDTLFSQGWL